MQVRRILPLSCWLLLTGCTDQCEEPLSAYSTPVSIYFLKSNGTESLFTLPSAYQSDSVRVYDEQGRIVPSMNGGVPETVYVSLLAENNAPSLQTPIKRQFILYLTRADQDTILAEYELKKNDCGVVAFKRLRVFYNGILSSETSGTYAPQLLIRKP